ncbi:hypothetical protein JCM11957_02360 [Caminibacter profundus]
MQSQKRYKSFTLIELLVSIIVIGIIMTTIPLFLQTLTTSAKVSIKEEVFFSQFSLLSLINTKYFDENNTRGDNFYKDLNATKGDSDLLIEKFGDELNRLGKKFINNNQFRSGSSDTVSTIGIDDENISDIATYDDIDDFDGFKENIKTGISSKGYSIQVEVYYIRDEANYNDQNILFNMDYTSLGKNGFSNIKLIKVYTTFADGSKIQLEYPTCNIGASKILSLEEINR